MSFISYLINGISLGSVYAIIALGYTMVYGIAKMLNFAHGDVIMVGAYIVLTCVTGAGLNPIVAIIIATIACTIFGVVIEGVAYRPLRNAASPLAVLITAIGVSYLLQNLALLIFGSNTKSFPEVIKLPNLKLAGGKLTITGTTILTIVLCIVIMAGLMLFINKTKAEVVKIGIDLKVPYEYTWSCYEGEDKPCGKCGTCIDRAEAFRLNGVKDPALENA